MSYLDLDNVRPSAGGTYRNLPRGVAAAWGFIDETSGTLALGENENISSVTDSALGQYDPNFTNDLDATLYPCMANNATSSDYLGVYCNQDTTGSVSINQRMNDGTSPGPAADADVQFVQFGDLA